MPPTDTLVTGLFSISYETSATQTSSSRVPKYPLCNYHKNQSFVQHPSVQASCFQSLEQFRGGGGDTLFQRQTHGISISPLAPNLYTIQAITHSFANCQKIASVLSITYTLNFSHVLCCHAITHSGGRGYPLFFPKWNFTLNLRPILRLKSGCVVSLGSRSSLGRAWLQPCRKSSRVNAASAAEGK
jgi:hypothetical protein